MCQKHKSTQAQAYESQLQHLQYREKTDKKLSLVSKTLMDRSPRHSKSKSMYWRSSTGKCYHFRKQPLLIYVNRTDGHQYHLPRSSRNIRRHQRSEDKQSICYWQHINRISLDGSHKKILANRITSAQLKHGTIKKKLPKKNMSPNEKNGGKSLFYL